jgi:hypothetical protein
MKKYSLALAAGVLFFAACSSNNNANNQAAIDSMANAKAAAMQNNMAAHNDSMINAVAKAKADSMEMAKHMETMGARKEGHGTSTHRSNHDAPTQAAPPQPSNSKDDKFNRLGGNVNNNSTQPNQQSTQTKDDKFNRLNGGK